MTLYIVPGKAEVVAAVWIYTNPQQLAFDARTGETTSGILMRHLRRHHLGETGKCLSPWHFLERQLYLPRNFRRVCASLYRPLKYRDFIMFHNTPLSTILDQDLTWSLIVCRGDYAALLKERHDMSRILVSDDQLPLKRRYRSPPRCAD